MMVTPPIPLVLDAFLPGIRVRETTKTGLS